MRTSNYLLRAAAVLAFAATVNACASAPLDLAFQRETSVAAVEQDFRAASDALIERVDEENWREQPGETGTVRGFFNRLIGGGEVAEDERSPVEAYIARAGEEPAAQLRADLASLSNLTQNAAQTALSVASAGAPLDSGALARDIASAEAALGSARRARAFFAAVGETIAADAAEAPQMSDSFARLDAAIEALAAGADAMAERRWAGEDALVG